MEEKIKKIEEEKKKKYLIPPSRKIFHCGIIMLISLAIGRISVQIGYEVDPMSLDDASLNAIDQLHRVYGNFLGLIIGTVGGVLYLIWTNLQKPKYHKEVMEETNKEIDEFVARILKEKEKK